VTETIEPIARRALQDAVIDRIKRMIENGALLPGARIPERQLCAQLGVSRTPLREAFQVLSARGILELQPGRGAVVRRLPPDEVDQMFEVLEVLEALAAERACGVMSDEALARIRALHDRMMSAYRARNRSRFFALNEEIHDEIVRASGSPVLQHVCASLGDHVRRIRYMSRITDGQWKTAVREHQAIIKALEARDARAAGKVLRQHLRTKRNRVKDLLA